MMIVMQNQGHPSLQSGQPLYTNILNVLHLGLFLLNLDRKGFSHIFISITVVGRGAFESAIYMG